MTKFTKMAVLVNITDFFFFFFVFWICLTNIETKG